MCIWAEKHVLPSTTSAKVITEPQFPWGGHLPILCWPVLLRAAGESKPVRMMRSLSGIHRVVPVIGLGRTTWQSPATKMREKWSQGLWGRRDASCVETDSALPLLFFSWGKISICSLDWLLTPGVVQGGLKVITLPPVTSEGCNYRHTRPCPADRAPLGHSCFCHVKPGRVTDISWYVD